MNSDDKSKAIWHGKQVLVTGAGGFIGSHLVAQLVEQGAEVRAFVRYNARGDYGLLNTLPSEVQDALEVISGDLRDSDAIAKAVAGCDTVFHLGAIISIPYSYLHPVETTSSNVMGTLNVLLACRDHGVRRLIHTSTSEVYGTALHVPISETHLLQGQSPYSVEMVCDLLQRDVEVEGDAQRMRPSRSEVMRLVADSSRAEEILGWQPLYDLREGLAETINWIDENLHFYHMGRYEI